MSSKLAVRRSPRRRAFSFAEVMFAVVILGVGFIMIAALFPVAIRQSKSTVDETSAAAFARVAANDVNLMAKDSNMIAMGTNPNAVYVDAFPTRINGTDFTPTVQLWESLRGNIISPTDPRYAWVPFYFRGIDPLTNAKLPYAQLILICVQATNKPVFTDDDVRPKITSTVVPAARANLRGRPVRVTIVNSPPPDPDYIGFANEAALAFDNGLNGSPNPNGRDAVAEGCFVIIRGGVPTANCSPVLDGRIYRVGVRRPDLDGATVSNLTSTGAQTPQALTNLQVWELRRGSILMPNPLAVPAWSPFLRQSRQSIPLPGSWVAVL